MSNPNFCPSCGEDLRKYQEDETQYSSQENSDDKPTREDYRRILNEELEKAEKADIAEETESDNSESDLTREDYEEVLERKLEEAREDGEQANSKAEEIDPEVSEAVKKLVETDREIIEHMRDGLQKDIALDIQDMADGKTQDLRILGD